MSERPLPTIDDIKAAAKRIAGRAVRTPLLKSRFLDDLTGADVWLKPECLQVTGSFKFRGAFNAISSLGEDERSRGVLATSSGNHAQGIAEAARLLGVSARIVMPSDAPRAKLARTRRSGAEIITYDRMTEDREVIAAGLAREHGLVFIHPYEHPAVIAGQGTVGLEIAEDLSAMEKRADRYLVCCGGGGLTAGSTLALKAAFPGITVHPCEPDGFDDYGRSLKSGRRERNARPGGSVCDAVLTDMPGEASFAILKDMAGPGLAVSDRQALEAVAFAFRELKLVVEPGGAVALAALLAAGRQFAGQTVAVTLSGGNIDADIMAEALALPETV